MATTTVQALKNADGNKIYPKTIADAVAYDSTRTVKGMLSNSVFCEHVKTVEDSDFPINATTLNGHTSDYFATVEDLADIASGVSVVDLGDGDTLKNYVGDQIGIHNSAKNVHQNLFNNITLYVDNSNGDDNYSGTSSQPFKTIQAAIDSCPITSKTLSIKLKSGIYNDSVLIKDRLNCEIWIGTATSEDDVKINNYIVVDSCKNVTFDRLQFIKTGNENKINAESTIYSNLFIYHSIFSVNNCTFINTDVDSKEYIGVYGIDSTGTIHNSNFTGYKNAINNNYGYFKCYNVNGENNSVAFFTNNGVTVFDDSSKISFTTTRICSNYGGLVINESAAQYLNMFSNATADNAAVFHNTIYRGKDITNYLNDGTLFTRISSGTFDDLFIGDYFTMNIAVDGYTVQCNKYVLAGFDTYLNSGYDNILTKHHAVIVPYSMLFTEAMDTKTTNAGYYNTNMHQVILPKIATQLKTILADHLLTYNDLLVNACLDDTESSGWNWYDINIRLLSEVDIKGSSVFGSGRDVGMDQQLPLFKLNSNFYIRKGSMWLSTSTNIRKNAYCIYSYAGEINIWDQTETNCGVFPKFLID